jgi:hypothetical protein
MRVIRQRDKCDDSGMQHCRSARCDDSISGMGLSAVCFCECPECSEAMREGEEPEHCRGSERAKAARDEQRGG